MDGRTVGAGCEIEAKAETSLRLIVNEAQSLSFKMEKMRALGL